MRRLLIGCVLVSVAVGLSASPAQAQTKVRKDPVGDAPSFVDIRSAKVKNNAKKYALTVRFTEVVHKNTTLVALILPTDANTDSYSIGSVPVGGGRHETRLYRSTAGGDSERVRCNVRDEWRAGVRGSVRLVLPQRCFGPDAGTLQTLPIALDKQTVNGVAVAARIRNVSGLNALRQGDAVDPEPEGVDILDSVITTRRGR